MSSTGWRSGPEGVTAWEVVDGERRAITPEEFLRRLRWPVTPIFDQVLDDLHACRNCLTTDCACCPGCGDTDADLDPSGHGYACVGL